MKVGNGLKRGYNWRFLFRSTSASGKPRVVVDCELLYKTKNDVEHVAGGYPYGRECCDKTVDKIREALSDLYRDAMEEGVSVVELAEVAGVERTMIWTTMDNPVVQSFAKTLALINRVEAVSINGKEGE